MREFSRMLWTVCIKDVFRENLKDKSSGAIKFEPTCSGIIFKNRYSMVWEVSKAL